MADLRVIRRKLKIAIAALAAVDVAAVALLFSPLVGSAPTRRAQLAQLWKEQQEKTRQVEPLRGMDKKIVVARGQIDDFYKTRLPEQNSAVSEELGKLSAQSGARIGGIKYKLNDVEPVGVRPLEIEADFSGDYLQLARLINSLEHDKLFFIVDSVDLGGEQQGVVKLQLKLETYIKALSQGKS